VDESVKGVRKSSKKGWQKNWITHPVSKRGFGFAIQLKTNWIFDPVEKDVGFFIQFKKWDFSSSS
jgi:hypothetical protein